MASATFKLWSRNATNIHLDHAQLEISHFMRVFKEKNDEPDCVKFNPHCINHLYEDRINLGPLRKMNAYMYENQLQHFKYAFLSKNKRLESLVKRVKADRMIPIDLKDQESFQFIVASKKLTKKFAIQSKNL